VSIAKPKSSRNSSVEAFIVCRQYTPPPEFRPEALERLLNQAVSAEVGCPLSGFAVVIVTLWQQ